MTENTGAPFARRGTRRNRRVVRISQPSRLTAAKRFIKSQSASSLAIAVGVAFGVVTLTVRGIITPAVLPQTSAAELAYSPAALRPALNPPDDARVPEVSTYTVKDGDTLLGVALRFGSTVEAISLASNLSSRNMLHIGQQLTIPPARSTLQTIEPGTTPAQLAASYGVDAAVLTAYNGIERADEEPLDRNVVVLPPSHEAMSSGPMFATLKTPASAIDAPRSAGLYYVEAGDTLFDIADKLGVDPDALMRVNKLSDGQVITAGRALNIPVWGSGDGDVTVRAASLNDTQSSASARPTPVVYEVSEGDTISTLADRFGVDTYTIVNNNDLSSPDSIGVGTQLTILPVSGLTYTVQPGDTLASIAQRYKVDLGPVIDFNYLKDVDNLTVGMELILPGASPLPPAPPPAPVVAQRPSTYVVGPGDTVLSIAKRFGVEPVDIVVANKMTSADRLSIGQELKIVPGAGASIAGNTATGSVSGPQTNAPAQPVQQAVTRNLPVPSSATQASQTVRPSAIGGGVVNFAMQYKGYRYVFGGTTPSGFDCSGFVYYVFNHAGSGISRGMWGQYGAGSHPGRGELQPGDIVFFQNTYMAGLSHDGIYIGGGQFIHASDERTGVTISSLSDAYWSAHWFGATRVN